MVDSEHPYASVSSELRGTAFASIRYVESTGSTNDDAVALLGDDSHFGATLIAEYQTKGAGRKGRSWLAQAGTSLLFTTIMPRSVPVANLWIVPFGVAICVRRALVLAGVPAQLHWPNDLLAGGRKISGILCVSRVSGDRAWVAAGVGINVMRTPGAEENIVPPPAFASDFGTIDRATLLRDVLLNFDIWHSMLEMPPRIARVWERQAGIPGARYRIVKDGTREPIEATALSLAIGGGLVVQHDDGTRETIALADARALR